MRTFDAFMVRPIYEAKHPERQGRSLTVKRVEWLICSLSGHDWAMYEQQVSVNAAIPGLTFS